ncbi:MAG: hypothetical protein ACYC21_12275 [Eubacteriales bacterium]
MGMVKSKTWIQKIVILVFIILLVFGAAPSVQGLEKQTDFAKRRVVVLLIDSLALGDLQDLPNFNRIIGSGGLGLMNTRTESYTSVNRTSAYLTVGMGVRAKLPEPKNGFTVEQKAVTGGTKTEPLFQIVNRNAGSLNELVRQNYPNYMLGNLGEMAKNLGKKISLVGNADTDKPQNESTLAAMDNSGVIGTGNISRDLLQKDSQFAWGHRTDINKLLAYSLEALKTSDIVFIDFGDTSRVNEAENKLKLNRADLLRMKTLALQSADMFLGKLLDQVDPDNTVLMIASPVPSAVEISRGNMSLAPIIFYEKGVPPGVLTSNTTRRSGLVTNTDISPTILHKLGVENKYLGFLGEEIYTVPNKANFQTVSGNLAQYISLKRSRYTVHSAYVILLSLALVVLYVPRFTGRKILDERWGRGLAVTVLALPAVSFIIPAILKMNMVYVDLLIVVITVFFGIFLSANYRRALAGMAWLSLASSLFLAVGLLTGSDILLRTPLGFDDVFMGGRYYGINNDCMGILLGSVVFAMFYFFERLQANSFLRIILGIIVFVAVIATQTPGYGANVGGTIAAMTTAVVGIMVLISGGEIKKGKVILTVVVVFMAELIIAYMDYRSGAQTHAGKVIGTFLSQGFGRKFLEILQSKLGLFAVMLVLPPWNILFAAEILIRYLLGKRMKSELESIKQDFPGVYSSFEVILYGGLVAFAFNDTGIIATAMMFTFLTMPLGIMLAGKTKLKKGGQVNTQKA